VFIAHPNIAVRFPLEICHKCRKLFVHGSLEIVRICHKDYCTWRRVVLQ
jgi:hypothetical protein